jgi:hypothetical protein
MLCGQTVESLNIKAGGTHTYVTTLQHQEPQSLIGDFMHVVQRIKHIKDKLNIVGIDSNSF